MATFHWRGFATPVPRKYTLTISGSWATNDTISLKIGGASLIVTVGTTVTTTGIASAINAAINGTTAVPGYISDEKRNANGQAIAQFSQVSSTVSGSVVTIVGTPGVDLTITSSKVSTSGTATLSSIQTPTGPNFLDNADNYLEGTLPVSNGDSIVFDWGTNDVRYGLSYFQTNTLSLNYTFTGDYRGGIGLPAINETWGYAEYLPRLLDVYGTTSSRSIRFIPGSQGFTDHRPIRIDLIDVTNLDIYSTHSRGSASDYGKPNIFIYGGGDATTGKLGSVSLQRGQFYFDYSDITIAADKGFKPNQLSLGAAGVAEKECYVIFGPSCQLYKSPNVIQISGGNIIFNCSTAEGADDTDVTIREGKVTIDEIGGDFLNFTAHEGAYIFLNNAGTIGTITLYGATLNTDEGAPSCAVSNLKVYQGSSLCDKRGSCINEFDLIGCDLNQITHKLGVSKKYTMIDAVP